MVKGDSLVLFESDQEVGLARAYSVDLRKRVVDAIEAGVSTREAARRFAIGESTAGAWHRVWRATGSLEPGRQGHPKISKLDAHEAFILALVDSKDRDITLAEIAGLLEAERGVRTCAASVHGFFGKRGITVKTYGPPVCKSNFIWRLIGLRKRIRHVGCLGAAKMEIRASRSS